MSQIPSLYCIHQHLELDLPTENRKDFSGIPLIVGQDPTAPMLQRIVDMQRDSVFTDIHTAYLQKMLRRLDTKHA